MPTVDPPADPGIGDSTGAGGDTDPTVGGTEPEPTDDPQGIDEEPGDVYVVPNPSVRLLINGDVMEGGFRIRSGDSVDVQLELQATDLDPSACRLTQAFEPDEPDGSPYRPICFGLSRRRRWRWRMGGTRSSLDARAVQAS